MGQSEASCHLKCQELTAIWSPSPGRKWAGIMISPYTGEEGGGKWMVVGLTHQLPVIYRVHTHTCTCTAVHVCTCVNGDITLQGSRTSLHGGL